MTAVEASSADVELRARATGFVRARVRALGGRRVIEVDARGERNAGALVRSDGQSIAAGARAAREQRLPLLIRIASSGADAGEGVSALDGWAGAAKEITANSGVVPSIAIVSGPTVSGPALMLGLVDHVIMTSEAYAFVSGPMMVEEFTGVPMSKEELGGPSVHDRTSGVASFDAYEALPPSANGSYDVRDIVGAVVDDGYLLEPHANWAANLVTAFAKIGGQPVGIVANQPQTVAGTLDIPASQKGGRFVALCDAFNLPIVTFVDTSGFYPGKDTEWRGMIRYGAQMAFAYARATVPRVNLTTRKSYGGAYIVMDSKRMGNDLALAWPSAEIAVMGAKGAVEILHRRNTPEERAELEVAYEERLLNPYIAAERGTIDAVIDPADTRAEIHAALSMLAGKRERLPRRRHDNTPL